MAAKDNPSHKSVAKEMPEVPEVGVDYGFLREDGHDDSLTIMVVKDRETRVTFSHLVPAKGASWNYSVNCLQDDIKHLGHTKTVLMHDQEAALASKHLRLRGHQLVGESARWAHLKALLAQREAQARRAHAYDGATEREERDEIARTARQRDGAGTAEAADPGHPG